MKIHEITEYLEGIAPIYLQEAYDNAGLIVGDPEQNVEKGLICLDATPEVIQEAIDNDFQMVISHHPIVFKGLKRFNGKNYVERAVMMAIKHDIALYAIHTNLDNVLQYGVNQRIGERLGLVNMKILKPKEGENEGIGAGVVGELEHPMKSMNFLKFVKDKMKTEMIRHTDLVVENVRKVAVCGGSGSFLLQNAKDSGAEIFITGDYKYHQFFDAEGEIIIADIGHFESEQFTIDLLKEKLSEKFSNFASHCTKIITNPINYF